MSDARLRHAIAFEAARLMYERVESEYFTAKHKAAKRLCRGNVKPADLPSNSEIRDLVQSFARVHEGEARTANLKAMRLEALKLMRILRRFRPRLVGPLSERMVRSRIRRRCLGCRQLGMNLCRRFFMRRLTEAYRGKNDLFCGQQIRSTYFEREYLSGIATDKLPPGLNCRGMEIEISSCVAEGTDCPATVSQWRKCLPALLDRIADDPCLPLGIQSQKDVAEFLEATQGCESLGRCGMFTP